MHVSPANVSPLKLMKCFKRLLSSSFRFIGTFLTFSFFQGSLTSPEAAQLLEEAIAGDQEKLIDILLYRKDGTPPPHHITTN